MLGPTRLRGRLYHHGRTIQHDFRVREMAAIPGRAGQLGQ